MMWKYHDNCLEGEKKVKKPQTGKIPVQYQIEHLLKMKFIVTAMPVHLLHWLKTWRMKALSRLTSPPHAEKPIPQFIFQSKALRMITDAPWYVPNVVFQRDLHIPSVKEEIQRLSSQYSARLNSHPNLLTANLKKQPTNRRLRRLQPTDLPTRFLL
jgi:hypothetical protein